MHINPDHYLETINGRVWTKKRNQQAWHQCIKDYCIELLQNANVQIVYVLIGCQGAGKSTWAKMKHEEEPQNIIFDAILVQKIEREYLIKLARIYKKSCIAVYFTTTLKECLFRNQLRDVDKRADEHALTNVFLHVEKPSLNEGFSSIVKI